MEQGADALPRPEQYQRFARPLCGARETTMPAQPAANEKRITVNRPFGKNGPRTTTVETNRLVAVFCGRTPISVATFFEPDLSVTAKPAPGIEWWTNLMPLLKEELGESWFENEFMPVALGEKIESATADRAKLFTVLAGWWSLTRMANSHATMDEFLQLVANRDPQAQFLFDELTTRLNRLAADALDEFPQAVLSLETTNFIEQLVSAMEQEGEQ